MREALGRLWRKLNGVGLLLSGNKRKNIASVSNPSPSPLFILGPHSYLKSNEARYRR
ncbi:hypothetical protein GCM10009069_18270 [Algimonas arctica]|uniref:Uncharacterized protein n=1 Tax=Algimonas arctica TaxID=1479486 RepID=A0A8J3G2N4_9PROT|nr:hypothetical protein GCM10009069_18270 [Algimonas arctica]